MSADTEPTLPTDPTPRPGRDGQDDVARELAARLATLPPIQVLYTDLDGTLLGPDGSLLHRADGQPSTVGAAAVVEALSAGLTVIPVSGRQRQQLQHDTRLLGLTDCIGEAGAVIQRDGALAYAWGQAPRDLADTPHDALLAAGAWDALRRAFPDDLALYEPWHRGREGSLLLHGAVDPAAADAVLADAGCAWARLIDNGEAAGWPGRQVRAYHLLPRGVGKAEAVAADLRARGLRPEQAVAVGDSPTDARLAQAVGLSAIVANGRGAGEDVLRLSAPMGEGVAQLVTAVVAARRRQEA